MMIHEDKSKRETEFFSYGDHYSLQCLGTYIFLFGANAKNIYFIYTLYIYVNKYGDATKIYMHTRVYTYMCMHVSIYTCFKYYQYLFHFKI